MSQNFKASIIVSTYNQPKYLAMVLAGLSLQTEKNFEVCIADDGSKDDTKEVVEKYKSKLFIKYFWQEDAGFRKSKILNKAIEASSGEYLIFLDGDCVPHKKFVEMHLKYKDKNSYLAGRRVEVSKKLSDKLNDEHVLGGMFNRYSLTFILDSLFGETKYYHRVTVTEPHVLRKIFNLDKIIDAKGCNWSAYREAVIAINGYDESYEGYGREDTDIELRLQYYGLKIKSVKSLAIQFHLFHKTRDFVPENDERLDNLKITKKFKCDNGIIKN